jgi:hypothetical protein
MSEQPAAPKAASKAQQQLSRLSRLVLASLVLAFASSVRAVRALLHLAPRGRIEQRRDQAKVRPDPAERSTEMKSRRQTSGGSSAACAAAGEANTHSSGGGGGGCKLERKDVEKNRRLHMKSLCLKLSSLLPPAATHASLLSDAAAAAASNPNNKVKATTASCPLESSLARLTPSRQISAMPSLVHSLLYWTAPMSFPRQK